MIRSFLARIRAVIAAHGWTDGILYLFSRTLAGMSRGRARFVRYALTVQPLASMPPVPERRTGRFTVREIGATETQLLAAMQRPMAALLDRYRQGAFCLGLFRSDELAGFAWLTIGAYQEDEVRCRFLPAPQGQAAWDFDVFIAPRFRLSGAFLQLWTGVARELRARGCEYSCSRISRFNLGSLSSHRRIGAEPVATANFLVLGPLQFMVAGIRPYLHVSASATRQPTLRIDTTRFRGGGQD